jgi:hypothetical protein
VVIGAWIVGLRRLARSPRLVLVVWLVNVATAAMLAVPLAVALEQGLRHRDGAVGMQRGFDYTWWSHWSSDRTDWTRSFGPDIQGAGFAVKNLDLLLRGELPVRLFSFAAPSSGGRGAPPALAPVFLALGALYLVLQVFLTGGMLAVLRSSRGTFTVRGLLYASGFYFGRLFRAGLFQLLLLLLVFGLSLPLSSWADRRASEAVSETTAMGLLLGRHLALLLAILAVHMISSYAKIVIVVEERRSAAMAYLTALGFCLSRPLRTIGHYLGMPLLAALLVAAFLLLDGRFEPTGFRTQLVTLGLCQAMLMGRIGLRLALLGGQTALFQGGGSAAAAAGDRAAGTTAPNQV